MSPQTNSRRKDNLIDKCDALYIWHKDAIYRIAFSAVGGNKEWALKLLEECMITACRNIERFGDEKSADSKAKMVAILYSLINKIYADVWQKIGLYDESLPTGFTEKERFDVDQIIIRNQHTVRLAKYAGQLTNTDKELIFMRYYMDIDPEELAKQYSCHPEDIRKRIFAVKRRIANMMRER